MTSWLFLKFALVALAGQTEIGYAFKSGDVHHFSETLNVKLESTSLEGGSRQARVSYRRTERVERVLEDGGADLLVTISHIEADDPEFCSFVALAHLENKQIRMHVDRFGTVTELNNQQEAGFTGSYWRKAGHEFENFFHTLPGTAVELGKPWEAKQVAAFEHPFFGSTDQISTYRYEVAESENSSKGEVTTIALQGSVQGVFQDEDSGSFVGTLEGSIIWNHEQGFEHETHIEYDTTFQIDHPDGAYSYRLMIDFNRLLAPHSGVR